MIDLPVVWSMDPLELFMASNIPDRFIPGMRVVGLAVVQYENIDAHDKHPDREYESGLSCPTGGNQEPQGQDVGDDGQPPWHDA